jgi:hypothetical protein
MFCHMCCHLCSVLCQTCYFFVSPHLQGMRVEVDFEGGKKLMS